MRLKTQFRHAVVKRVQKKSIREKYQIFANFYHNKNHNPIISFEKKTQHKGSSDNL